MDYEIISLGFNCQPRTYLTLNGLIASKKLGRKTMIFDLAFHPTKGLIKILENNFSDYFEDIVYEFYEPFHQYNWLIKKYDVILNHEDNDFEKLKSKYQTRIENFKNILSSDKFLFFVHTLDEKANADDINLLYETLKNIRGEKPFKLIIWDMFENFEKDEINTNISVFQLLHPYEDTSDWCKSEKQNAVTKLWQKTLIDYTKDEIKNNGFDIKTFKLPLTDKLKRKIKPILKNIFTITNDSDLNAKVLIIFGFKFKIKQLK